jgi:Protein of unknown function (DUF3828)
VKSWTGRAGRAALAGALLGLLLSPAAGADEAASPAALVQELYARGTKGASPFERPEDKALLERFFARPLADAIRKDAKDAKGEIGAMDADPLYDAQDFDIKNFAVGAPAIAGRTAKVAVSFQNFGEKTTVTYLLTRTAAGWRIADIQYADGRSLLAIYRRAAH